MAVKERKKSERAEPSPDPDFVVPNPSELSDEVNEALAERGKFDQQYAELKQREAHLSEKLRSYTTGSIKLGETSREEANALEQLRQQLQEVRFELTIVERAREEARLNFQTGNAKASRLVCEKVYPEWRARQRACVLPLFQFVEAHRALMELKERLHGHEVRWLPFLPNVQFNELIDRIDRDELRELLHNEIISEDEIPTVLRNRFDL